MTHFWNIAVSSLVLSATCLTTLSANAHPGRTNSSGCHTNHSTGDYHCHGGSTSAPVPSSRPVQEYVDNVCPDGGRLEDASGQLRNGWTGDYTNVNLRTGPTTTSGVVTQIGPQSAVQIHSWRDMSDGRWAWITFTDAHDDVDYNGWARQPYVDCIPLDW